MAVACRILLRIRNNSDRSFRENQNTCFVFNNFVPISHAVCEGKVETYCTAALATDDNMTRRMYFYVWIPTATDTHSEPTAFPQQQRLRGAPRCYV
jgi:hypothetical protein